MGKVKKAKVQTTTLQGIELASYDGERWFIRDIAERKRVGIFGTYTLQEWESILRKIEKANQEVLCG